MKRVANKAYVHVSAVGELPQGLRRRVDVAAARVPRGWSLARIDLKSPAVMLGWTESWETEAHPRLLVSRLVVPGKNVTVTDYRKRASKPIYHRKESMVRRAHPQFAQFAALSKAEEVAGLLGRSDIGTDKAWARVLAAAGYKVVGHTLVKASDLIGVPNKGRGNRATVEQRILGLLPAELTHKSGMRDWAAHDPRVVITELKPSLFEPGTVEIEIRAESLPFAPNPRGAELGRFAARLLPKGREQMLLERARWRFSPNNRGVRGGCTREWSRARAAGVTRLAHVTGARLELNLQNRGIGRAGYDALLAWAAENGAALIPARCIGLDTSPEAERTWRALLRDYPSSGSMAWLPEAVRGRGNTSVTICARPQIVTGVLIDLYGYRVDAAEVRRVLWEDMDDRAGQRLFANEEELAWAVEASLSQAEDLASMHFPLTVWRGLSWPRPTEIDLRGEVGASWSTSRSAAEVFVNENEYGALLTGVIERPEDVDWGGALRQRIQYDVVEAYGPEEDEIRGVVKHIRVVR